MDRMARRINRLRKHFDRIPTGNHETLLKILAEEIKHTENDAIKHWLMLFRDILNSIHRGAFEPLAMEVAANV